MTAKELMNPRFKVIADWPDRSDYGLKVGDVVQLDTRLDGDKKPSWILKNCKHYEPFFEQFPHLFYAMPWWEDRSVGDMPGKLKYSELWMNSHGLHQHIYEITKWDMRNLFGYTNKEYTMGCALDLFPKSLGPKGFAYIPCD